LIYSELNDNEFDITMYVPTKGRPDNAKRLQDQFYKTARLSSRIVFINSDNDDKLHMYTGLNERIVVTPEKPGFVSPLNLGYRIDRRKYFSFAVGFMGDDHLPRTVGWDEVFIKNLLDLDSGFVYGNDGFQGARIPTHIAMTSDIPLTLGFMTLPQLKHLYADNFWLDLGKSISKIRYLPEVVIEHMHPAAGKATYDEGYAFSGDYNLDCEDRANYVKYLSEDLEGDTRRVLGMIRRTQKI